MCTLTLNSLIITINWISDPLIVITDFHQAPNQCLTTTPCSGAINKVFSDDHLIDATKSGSYSKTFYEHVEKVKNIL